MKKSLLLLTVLLAPVSALADGSGTGHVLVKTKIGVTEASPLHFGTLTGDLSQASTFSVTADGDTNMDGGIQSMVGSSPATFNFQGTADTPINISTQPATNPTNGNSSFTDFKVGFPPVRRGQTISNDTQITLDGGGAGTVNVGAEGGLDANSTTGLYNGTYTLVASY